MILGGDRGRNFLSVKGRSLRSRLWGVEEILESTLSSEVCVPFKHYCERAERCGMRVRLCVFIAAYLELRTTLRYVQRP